MTNFPEDSVLPFRATRDLGVREVRALSLHAARLGLEPMFDTQSTTLSREEFLTHVVKATYPTSPDSFLGKEHFRVIGDELALDRKHMSRIFTHLCYPLRVGTIVDPQDVDLRVRTRAQVGMSKPAMMNLKSQYHSERQRKHEEWFKDLPPDDETVIQAGGIIDISRDHDRANELGILGTYWTFKAFGEGLADIVNYPSTPPLAASEIPDQPTGNS